MKKIVKVLSCIAAPLMFVIGVLAGCHKGKDVNIPQGEEGLILDAEVKPDITPAYETYSKAALAEYKGVAANYLTDGEVDFNNETVISAASTAAAKLYAYACYNERTLDKYVYFGDQTGNTDLGSSGSAVAKRQEYYLRVNESEETCGYRFHYTIKKVTEASGLVGTFKSKFESARIRLTDETSLLYRFEGSNIEIGEEDKSLGVELLKCDWKTGDDWGKADVEMVKGEYLEPDAIEADIQANAGEDNYTIRGNINILAENIVKFAQITEDEDGTINVFMVVNTEVANKDEASLTMLRNANSSGNCTWKSGEADEGIADDTGLRIIFRLWGNGLFRSYTIIERWTGSVATIFSGTAESQTTVCYSYSDRDCDMTDNLKMLEAAKAALNGEE